MASDSTKNETTTADGMESVVQWHAQHCHLLPVENRFIVINFGDNVWSLPASKAIEWAFERYSNEGWYEQCELDEDQALVQPTGNELRDAVEVNADLVSETLWKNWHRVKHLFTRHSGSFEGPNDAIWWFQENGGTIEELTNLELENQDPVGGSPLMFSDQWLAVH